MKLVKHPPKLQPHFRLVNPNIRTTSTRDTESELAHLLLLCANSNKISWALAQEARRKLLHLITRFVQTPAHRGIRFLPGPEPTEGPVQFIVIPPGTDEKSLFKGFSVQPYNLLAAMIVWNAPVLCVQTCSVGLELSQDAAAAGVGRPPTRRQYRTGEIEDGYEFEWQRNNRLQVCLFVVSFVDEERLHVRVPVWSATDHIPKSDLTPTLFYMAFGSFDGHAGRSIAGRLLGRVAWQLPRCTYVSSSRSGCNPLEFAGAAMETAIRSGDWGRSNGPLLLQASSYCRPNLTGWNNGLCFWRASNGTNLPAGPPYNAGNTYLCGGIHYAIQYGLQMDVIHALVAADSRVITKAACTHTTITTPQAPIDFLLSKYGASNLVSGDLSKTEQAIDLVSMFLTHPEFTHCEPWKLLVSLLRFRFQDHADFHHMERFATIIRTYIASLQPTELQLALNGYRGKRVINALCRWPGVGTDRSEDNFPNTRPKMPWASDILGDILSVQPSVTRLVIDTLRQKPAGSQQTTGSLVMAAVASNRFMPALLLRCLHLTPPPVSLKGVLGAVFQLLGDVYVRPTLTNAGAIWRNNITLNTMLHCSGPDLEFLFEVRRRGYKLTGTPGEHNHRTYTYASLNNPGGYPLCIVPTIYLPHVMNHCLNDIWRWQARQSVMLDLQVWTTKSHNASSDYRMKIAVYTVMASASAAWKRGRLPRLPNDMVLQVLRFCQRYTLGGLLDAVVDEQMSRRRYHAFFADHLFCNRGDGWRHKDSVTRDANGACVYTGDPA